MQQLLIFLKELSENNNRDWFEANRQRYLALKEQYERWLEGVIDGIAKFDAVTGRPAVKDCVFRIYRDVRFSKDKQPYKTHIGAFIAAGGRKSEKAGFYVHIEPSNSLMGGGIYMPPPENLKKIRNEIYFNGNDFKKILNDPGFRKVFPGLYDDKISRAPREYDPTVADTELLKYKSYFVERSFTDREVTAAGFAAKVVESCRIILPMNNFLNRAFMEI